MARVADAAGATCDRREFSIGLRTVELDRSRRAQGSRFCFRVNGQDVFCRGGNLGPQDAILARISDAKYEKLVAEAKNANMNMFRINGCSIYEGPAFYEACDRAGIPDLPRLHADRHHLSRKRRAVRGRCPGRNPGGGPHVAASSEHRAVERQQRMHSGSSPDSPVMGGKLYNRVIPESACISIRSGPTGPAARPAAGPEQRAVGDCHWWLRRL